MDGSWPNRTKRRGLRLPVELPVIVERAGTRLRGQTTNIGFGGAFVQGPAGLSYGELIDLWMPLLGPGTLSRLPSVVRWCDDTGFGVQFLELGVREAHALSELVLRDAKGK